MLGGDTGRALLGGLLYSSSPSRPGLQEWPLTVHPNWAGMLGGRDVLVSGPCFTSGPDGGAGVLCKYDDVLVDGSQVCVVFLSGKILCGSRDLPPN